MVTEFESAESIHEQVRTHYAAAAVRASNGACCAPGDEPIGSELYTALDRSELPDMPPLETTAVEGGLDGPSAPLGGDGPTDVPRTATE